MREFFVPNAVKGKDEELYASFAKMAGLPVPPVDQRVQSIEWVHDGEEWVATVGEQLRGTRTRMRTRQGRRIPITNHLSDRATVLAIFPGDPYVVVTNARPIEDLRSHWANPFMAGIPRVVRRFETQLQGD